MSLIERKWFICCAFFTSAVVFELQVMSSSNWDTLHTFLLPAVNNQLFDLGGVKDQVVIPTPPRQLLHLISKSRLIIPWDEPRHGGVTDRFDDALAGVGRGAAVGVEGEG